MMKKLIPAAVLAALMLTACQETPQETAKDVSAARQDAAKDVKEAREDKREDVAEANAEVAGARQDFEQDSNAAMKKLTAAEAEAMVKTANANYDIAIAQISGRADVARQACGAMTGVEKDACLSNAEATFEAEKAAAIAQRDEVLVAAEHHEE